MQINKPSGELCSKLRHVQWLLLPPTYSLAMERCYQNKGRDHYFKSAARQQKANTRQPQVIRLWLELELHTKELLLLGVYLSRCLEGKVRQCYQQSDGPIGGESLIDSGCSELDGGVPVRGFHTRTIFSFYTLHVRSSDTYWDKT